MRGHSGWSELSWDLIREGDSAPCIPATVLPPFDRPCIHPAQPWLNGTPLTVPSGWTRDKRTHKHQQPHTHKVTKAMQHYHDFSPCNDSSCDGVKWMNTSGKDKQEWKYVTVSPGVRWCIIWPLRGASVLRGRTRGKEHACFGSLQSLRYEIFPS